MRKLFERIVDFMEENGSIQSEYRDIYLFALQTVAVYAFNIGTGVVIGAAFGELLYCMIFLIAFMLLRQEAGGYHAPGWMSCYFLSCGILVLTLLWIKAEFAYQTCLTIAAALAAGMGIFLFAPLEDKNKPLEEAEKKVSVDYKREDMMLTKQNVLLTLIDKCKLPLGKKHDDIVRDIRTVERINLNVEEYANCEEVKFFIGKTNREGILFIK